MPPKSKLHFPEVYFDEACNERNKLMLDGFEIDTPSSNSIKYTMIDICWLNFAATAGLLAEK